MSNELDLPLTSDGTGYEKAAVEEHAAREGDKARRLVEQAQILLTNAEQRKREIIADAEEQVANVTGDLEAVRTERLAEINSELEAAREEAANVARSADDDARRKVAAAEKKASHIIEEAMSKVHALVKTAQGKLETAKTESAAIQTEILERYADATAQAGKFVTDAEAVADETMQEANEEASRLRLDAETMLAYASEESKIIKAEGRKEAELMVEEATAYRDEVARWAEEELAAARTTLEHFKGFYDDTVSRLAALFSTNLDVANQLAGVQFPDGSNLYPSEAFTPASTSTEDEAPKVSKESPAKAEAAEVKEESFAHVTETVELDSSDVSLSSDEAEELNSLLSVLEDGEDEETIELDDHKVSDLASKDTEVKVYEEDDEDDDDLLLVEDKDSK